MASAQHAFKSSKHQSYAFIGVNAWLLSVYTALIIARSPFLFTHGRVWGEEGTVYLQYAWSHDWLIALTAPHQGYFGLWPNLCGMLAAKLIPLDYTAVLLPILALCIQVLAGWLLLECDLFETTALQAGALAVLLFTSEYEVWLNTINSQFFLLLCVAFVLFSRADRLPVSRIVVLVTSALTSPMTVVLLPWFALRAWVDRSRQRWVQTSFLGLASLAQIIIDIHEQFKGNVQVRRFQPSGVAPVYFTRYLMRPFFGRLGETGAATLVLNQPNSFWSAHIHRHLTLSPAMILLWAVIDLAFLAFIFWITRNTLEHQAWWLLGVSLSLASFCLYSALGGTYELAERYVFDSAVLMGLALLLASMSGTRSQAFLPRVLLTLMLLSGVADFIRFRSWAAHERPDGPDWKHQVEQQAGADTPEYNLSVSPREWKHVLLPKVQ